MSSGGERTATSEPRTEAGPASFDSVQWADFRQADGRHYAWQTSFPPLADAERAMVLAAVGGLRGSILEVGCGEGANLHHARGAPLSFVGSDWSTDKLRFARGVHGHGRFATADAAALPFLTGAFDNVLVRDLLHHVARPVDVLRECCRCLRVGGSLVIVEPNPSNPLILLQGLVVRSERHILGRRAACLEREIAATPAEFQSLSWHQPFPVARMVFHHRLGLPRLARWRGVRAFVAAVEIAGRALPRWAWCYMVIRCRRTEPGG